MVQTCTPASDSVAVSRWTAHAPTKGRAYSVYIFYKSIIKAFIHIYTAMQAASLPAFAKARKVVVAVFASVAWP